LTLPRLSRTPRPARHAGRTSPDRTRGFSLLEVLAAIVIFSLGAAVLFSWIGQTASRMRTVSTDQQQLFAQLNALEFARGLNPMQEPTGDMALGNSRVQWQAQAVGEESPVRTLTGSPGWYVVRLYEVKLSVEQDKLGASHQQLYLAGWRQVKKQQKELPFGN
jgi:prepilin-type N-terminal cleavage/methylation domain-containing protein